MMDEVFFNPSNSKECLSSSRNKIMSGVYKKMSDVGRGVRVRGKLSFITPTVMSVLEFFLADPLKECYEREVARRAGVSRGSAHRILRLLFELGFLDREERGRMLIYRLNLKEPVVRQFKILVNIFALRKLVEKLKMRSRRIVLFGSCAQGLDVKESDVDLLIIVLEKESVRRIISGFNRESERKVAAVVVDVNEFVRLKREDRPLYENVERGVVLWEAE
jgi:predicted nucleotidyltransferase